MDILTSQTFSRHASELRKLQDAQRLADELVKELEERLARLEAAQKETQPQDKP